MSIRNTDNMKLFERVKIGNVVLPNRIGLAPMGMRSSDGSFQDNSCRYYERVAKGGTGLIITGNAMATTEFEPRSNYLLNDFQQVCALAKAAEFVHYQGSKIFLQIGPGLGRVGHKDPTTPPHAPSAIDAKFFPGVLCTPFTVEEIKRLIAAVAQTAAYAKTAGCDGCEIHAYGGYLVDQFLTKKWNKRTDEYGGDLKGRMTFLFEILDTIREKVGADFPIIVKVTIDHCMPEDPEMRTLDEGLEMCRLLKEHGNFDAIHFDRGCYEKYYYQIPTVYEPHGINIEAYKKAKAVMGDIPVLGHGKLNDPEIAEKAIEEGAVDIVLMGHQLIADPDWTNKVKSGDWESINFCIGCNECLNTGFHGKHRTCAINPTSGRETDFPLKKTTHPKRILVVGGGCGGMKAALMGSWMGHDVTLWEKTDRLGGLLLAAGAPDFKHDMMTFIEHMIYRLKKTDVKIEMNKTATAQEIIEGNWDAVILASGSRPVIPPIPGIDGKNVTTAVDVLRNGTKLTGKVAVIGGGLVGIETLLHIEKTASKVYCVEMMDDILKTATHLFNNDQSLRNMMAHSNCELHLSTKVLSIDENGLTCSHDNKEFHIDCDTVVLAIGLRANNELEQALWGKVKVLRPIGDAAKSPGLVYQAVNQGFHMVRTLE